MCVYFFISVFYFLKYTHVIILTLKYVMVMFLQARFQQMIPLFYYVYYVYITFITFILSKFLDRERTLITLYKIQ